MILATIPEPNDFWRVDLVLGCPYEHSGVIPSYMIIYRKDSGKGQLHWPVQIQYHGHRILGRNAAFFKEELDESMSRTFNEYLALH